MSAGSQIHCVHPMSWISVHRNRDLSGVVNRITEYAKYTEARESEKARPHARPPTSKAKGIERMMAVKKITDEQTFRIHIGAAAEYALRRTQPDFMLPKVPRYWSTYSVPCVEKSLHSPLVAACYLLNLLVMVWRSWPIRSFIHLPGRSTLVVIAMTLLAKFSAPYDGMVVGT